jgi:uncharacterized protein
MSPDGPRLGIISDTHGWLRPEAAAALQGCAAILHAGDIGDPGLLDRLSQIAPVTAVRGNVDREDDVRLPLIHVYLWQNEYFYLLHNLDDLQIDPRAAGFRAVIYGHSHRASLERKDGVLYLNPGSAGPTRFGEPASLAILRLGAQGPEAEFVRLEGA